MTTYRTVMADEMIDANERGELEMPPGFRIGPRDLQLALGAFSWVTIYDDGAPEEFEGREVHIEVARNESGPYIVERRVIG